MSVESLEKFDPSVVNDEVYRDGISVVKGAFPREWAEQLDRDLCREFMEALRTPEGVAPRGWNRFYYEPYVEKVPAFFEMLGHKAVQAVAAHMLGEDWRVVEFGSDIPLPGAENQPFHRDFILPDITRRDGRLTSIAINATAVDVVDGPFQAVLGTQFDTGEDFEGGMFPLDGRTAELEGELKSFYAKMGNFSVRSGLMLHRGSTMSSKSRMRPVAIWGLVSREDRAIVDRLKNPSDPKPPRIRMSQQAYDTLSPEMQERLSVEIVSKTTAELPPYHTEHSFEGLKMDARKSR